MKYTTAVVLAAGRGARFKKRGVSKPLIKINAHPSIIYCLKILNQHPFIRDIIVVGNLGNFKEITTSIRRYRIAKVRGIVLGGKERRDSVAKGLAGLTSKTALILIHDGVRPFIDKKMVSHVIKAGARYGAAIVGVPVKATIKKIKNKKSKIKNRAAFVIEKTLDRNTLWEIQTPQVFKKNLLLRAYKRYPGLPVTDDAALVEKMGAQVRVVMGSYANIKITTPEDLLLAEAIAKNRDTLPIG